MHLRFLAVVLFFSIIKITSAATFKPGFYGASISNQIVEPTSLAIAKDGRVFVTQKNGIVRLFVNDVLQTDPFLELAVEVTGESGLSSIELDPNFDVNNYYYVYYTVKNENHNRVSRFTATGNHTVPGSEVVLYNIDPLHGIMHNGGGLRCDGNGKIYFATGDGEHNGTSQDLNTDLGKMLRINTDGTIPSDNPFYSQLNGKYRAIYAYGLRNPNTMDYDTASKRLFINDVGFLTYEEINFLVAGKNYGWSLIEGPLGTQTPPANYMDPFFSYHHNNGCAVTAGAFYQAEDKMFPSKYWNKYLFIDLCRGHLCALDPNNNNSIDTIAYGLQWINNFRVSSDGALYGVGYYTNSIIKITYGGAMAPHVTLQPTDVTASVGENATFNVQSIGSDTLVYNWYVNDTLYYSGSNNYINVLNVTAGFDSTAVYCVVSNNLGSDTTVSTYLYVTTNARPNITFVSPGVNNLYKSGDTIVYHAIANDAEDGLISGSSYQWKAEFMHNVHSHPAFEVSGIDSSAFIVPFDGELDTNVWYRITCKVVDSYGLSKSDFREVHPIIKNYQLNSSPSGLKLLVNNATKYTPFLSRGVALKQYIIHAPEYQVKNDSLFKFSNWLNGGTNNDTLIYLNENNVTAVYTYEQNFYDGDGDGLLAKYYNSDSLQGPVIIQRVDTVVNNFWDWGSPDQSINAEQFSIHWSGYLKAPISDAYTFYVEYNDAAILEFDNEVKFSNWTETNVVTRIDSFTVGLEGNMYYPLDLKYFEYLWQSKCVLKWRSKYFPKDIVPKRFLYSSNNGLPLALNGNNSDVKIYPNPVNNILFLEGVNANTLIEIFDVTGKLLIEETMNENKKLLNVSNLYAGVYFVKINTSNGINMLRIVKQ